MVAGLGPRIAPSSKDVPAYADAPIGQRFTIGAYIGVPLHYADGSLFGTLCAIHPSPRPEIIAEELPMIELLAGMLSALLNAELAAADADRRAERARDEAESDALTGLLNRRAWDRLLAAEEARCRRYGNPACVAVVDLDGLKATNDAEGHAAGDRLICQAAQALRGAVRERDIVARIGGDEFALLGVECDPARAHHLEERLKAALAEAGVQASVGIAPLVLASGLQHAWHEADQRMYRAKAVRNSGLVS
jgi:diguanylate cyclase (GGDEF)-like protein